MPAERFARAAHGSPDLLARDVTSFSAIGLDARFAGRVVARQECVVCGAAGGRGGLRRRCRPRARALRPGRGVPAGRRGCARRGRHAGRSRSRASRAAVLAGERTALDFLMMLSGIATETARWVEAAGPDLAVCDTRKTPPGLRALSKYAVRRRRRHQPPRGPATTWCSSRTTTSARPVASPLRSSRRAARIPSCSSRSRPTRCAQALEAVDARRRHRACSTTWPTPTLAEAVRAVREAAERLGRTVLTEASGGITLDRLAGVASDRRRSREHERADDGRPVVDFGLDEA